MDVQEVVRELMAAQHVTLEAMGERMGGINRSTVLNALGRRQRSMSVDKAVGYLGNLGYELMAVPKGSRVPTGGYRIEASDGE